MKLIKFNDFNIKKKKKKLMTLNENSQLFITGDVKTENIKVIFSQ